MYNYQQDNSIDNIFIPDIYNQQHSYHLYLYIHSRCLIFYYLSFYSIPIFVLFLYFIQFVYKLIRESHMRVILIVSVLCVVLLLAHSQVTYSSCAQNANRVCSTNSNKTDFLLSMKKGGTNVLSTSTYLYDFFLCQEYNYDCGYIPEEESYTTIANGVDLNMTQVQLDTITTNNSTFNLIKPYLGAKGDMAVCGMKLFPLHLTAAESKQVLDGYMAQLVSTVTASYNLDRNTSTTKVWTDININIRTAVLQKLKSNEGLIRNSTLWNNLCLNNFVQLSVQLKQYYKSNDQQIDLHAAYLIDSVTQQCDKQQSISFLVDQSGSVGAANFDLQVSFLKQYISQTKDNLQKMSIHFYSSTFQQYINFGTNSTYIMDRLNAKTYPGGGTYTGDAINQTVSRILAQNFPNGLPKILAILTDGGSTDAISGSVRNMVQQDIYPIAVGIGSGTNVTQLLQIAQSPSNYIQVNTFADLPKLVQFISNFFCKQIKTIRINQTIYGNYVRVPTSPSFFRVVKSPASEGRVYQLDISFEQDPMLHNQSIDESQIDPFPDQFTEYLTSENYEAYNRSLVGIPKKVYFIKPQQQIDYRVKKNISSTMNATVSYVSVRGNSMAFNVSLKECQTLKCQQEIQYYRSITGKNKTNNTDTNSLIIIPAEQDLSIFIIIGATLATLAGLCLLGILGFRKFNDQQQEQKPIKRESIPVETIATNPNIQQTLFPANTVDKISKKSQKMASIKKSSKSSSVSQSSERSSDQQ